MAKSIAKRLYVELGGVSLGKKDTAKISCSAKFLDNSIDANAAQALLAGGQLHCRFEQSGEQMKLPLKGTDAAPTIVEFDGTCHRIGMDQEEFTFGLSFPKSAAAANDLAEFAGKSAKLSVTRTGDIDDDEEADGEEESDESDDGGDDAADAQEGNEPALRARKAK